MTCALQRIKAADQNQAVLRSASGNKCFLCEATEESPAVSSGFPPSPGFPAASPAKDFLFYFEYHSISWSNNLQAMLAWLDSEIDRGSRF